MGLTQEEAATIIQRKWQQYSKVKAAKKIQGCYRRYKTRQEVISRKKERFNSLGFDIEYQCPYTMLHCYEIPEELHLVLNMGQSRKVCDLWHCLIWINQFDFLTLPKHHWGIEMKKDEFEKIVGLGGTYLTYLHRKLAMYIGIENANYKKINNYQPILKQYIKYLEDHVEEVKQLLTNIRQTNYYRNFNQKKFQELEEEYAAMMNSLYDIYFNHPLIGEQANYRYVKLPDATSLNMYHHGFLMQIEEQIDKAEKFRIYIDELLVRAGLKQPSAERYPIKEGYEPEKGNKIHDVEPSAPPPPSAPLMYPDLNQY